MDTLLSIIIIISSVLLTLVVFAQNPKGGGLSSDFGSASQLGGVQKTNDFVEKATWYLAAFIMVLSIVMTLRVKPTTIATQEQTPTEQGAPGQADGQE